MKKLFVIIAIFVATAGFVIVNSAFKGSDVQLTITNKTDSDIDQVHFIHDGTDSGDVLGDNEILHPGESVTVEFDCKVVADKDVKVKLIFEDGKDFSFDDDVCEGDFSWDITNDGGHKD